MTDREKHIKNLSYIMDSMPDDACGDWRDSLAYAISSLKTDEAYQLMYEDVEVYDKDTVAWMFKELQLEIGKMSDTVDDGRTVTITSWKGMQKKICNIIQQKINSLKEIKDGSN